MDLSNVDQIEELFKTRENMQYSILTGKFTKAMMYTKAGKAMPSMLKGFGESLLEKGVFNTWMYQEQDLIQAFAKSYAERIVCEAFQEVLVQPDVQGTDLEPMLRKILQLHLLSSLEKDLPWFIENDLLTSKQGAQVRNRRKNIYLSFLFLLLYF